MKKWKQLVCILLLMSVSMLFSACAAGTTQMEKPAESESASELEAGTEAGQTPELPEKAEEGEEAAQDNTAAAEEKSSAAALPAEADAERVREEVGVEEQPQEVQKEENASTEPDPESEWLIALDDTGFLQSGEVLVKAYAIDDTYAVVYTKTGEGAHGFLGRAFLLDRRNGSTEELYNSATDENGIELSTLLPVRVGERVLFGWRMMYWSTSTDYYCTLEQGTLKKCSFPLYSGKYLGNGEFVDAAKEYDLNDLEPDDEGYILPPFWSYKYYWYFWSEDVMDLRAYAGVEITTEELAQLETKTATVQEFIREQERQGYELDEMYLRGNGILNLNFHMQEDGYQCFCYAVFVYSDGGFDAVADDLTIGDTVPAALYGGRYLSSRKTDECSEAVVFPPLAAIRAAQ